MSEQEGPMLDMRAIIARIDRRLTEADRLFTEQRKLSAEFMKMQSETNALAVGQIRKQAQQADEQARRLAEAEKFFAGQHKLSAEANKLAWDAQLAPWFAIAAGIGGLLGAASFIAYLMDLLAACRG